MADNTITRLYEQRRLTRRKLVLGIIAVSVIIASAFMIENRINNAIKDFTIEKSSITDEKAIFIPLKQLDTNIIAVKASDGSYRLAFDDCTGCYYQYGKHSGFENTNDNTALICKTCGCKISYDDMGFFTEECAPYSIAESEIISDDEKFVLPASYLKNKKEILEAWRSGSVKGDIKEISHRNSQKN